MSASAAVSNPVIRMEGVAIGSMHNAAALVAEQVDWTVAPGDYWVVAGLQGSGKTDFIMTAGGLMGPLRGSYRLFNTAMPIFEGHHLDTRLRLGLVFDGGQLLHHLTVGENVALPLRYHRNLSQSEAEPEVRALLQAMDLTPWEEVTPGALGRNWHKRVGLARALMLRPELLLVDNPLAGLDLRHTNWWLDFLDQLSHGHPQLGGRPITLVVTAADMRPWKDRAKKFAVLKNQRFVILGDWQQAQAAEVELIKELGMRE